MKKELSIDQKKSRAEYARKWRRDNPEKTASHAKKSRIKNKEKVKERQKKWASENVEHRSQKQREWYQNNKDRIRDLQLQNQFGITIKQYDTMLLLQNGVCGLCGGDSDAKNKTFAVDHDHSNGRIRALLCRGCNVGIGNLKDSPELLEKAASYIRKFRK